MRWQSTCRQRSSNLHKIDPGWQRSH
jgi:hypothetical protein